ncbi:hypothetical protein V1289_004846 [Bradyrhizobium sp. AZCC 2289]
MDLDESRLKVLADLGEEILAALHTISDAAHDALAYGRIGPSPETLLRQSNMMVGDAKPERFIGATVSEAKEALRRLSSDPFVARVEIDWNEGSGGRRETYYLARGSTCGFLTKIPKANFITSLSDLGAIAEFDAGEIADITVNGRERKGRILKKTVLSPKLQEAIWDALIASFEIAGWGTVSEIVRADSLREALESIKAQLEGAGVDDDIVGGLMKQIGEIHAERSRARRKVVERIALRDQPILNRFQGEVFRLPLNRQVLLFGPPGSGKTTTLIKRLAQKRTSEALSEEERLLVSEYSRDRFMGANAWAMFCPSELLKAYLGRAFNREGVPDDRNVRTWEKERPYLARDVLNILRSGSSGRFQLETDRSVVADETSLGIVRLHDEFSRHVESVLLARCEEALAGLLSVDDSTIQRQALALRSSFGTAGKLTFDDLLRLVDGADDLRGEVKRIDDRVTTETSDILNSVLKRNPEVFRETIDKLSQLKGEEDDGGEDDAEDDVLSGASSDPRAEALELLMRAMRDRARAIVLDRRLGGRSARVVELIGTRMPEPARLRRLGADIILRSRIRSLIQAPRSAVLGVPTIYSRYRRQASREGSPHFKPGAETSGFIARNQISGHETDILLFVMLRNARRIIRHARGSRNDAIGRNEWLARIESRYLTQVFVDEATDLSAVQLACTIELADPRLRSWFACGDLRQRITVHGVSALSELEWLDRWTDIRIDVRKIDVGYRQSRRLRELSDDFAAQIDASPIEPTKPSKGDDEADVRPLLAEGLQGEGLARWLADRIVEVEAGVGSLPSIAVFVDDGALVEPLAGAVRELLKQHNIAVMGYKDGLVVGDEREVRVFDIRHVKGMEFEAVFFVGVDDMAARNPDMFYRFVYVGITRAATYLGLTCAKRLPPVLEPVRSHFSDGSWSAGDGQADQSALGETEPVALR